MPTKHQTLPLLALLPLLAAAHTTPTPKSIEVITPIFHQLVAFQLPTLYNFNEPPQMNQNFYLHEFIPRNETFDNWTRMTTVTGAHGAVTRGETAQQRAATIAAGFQTNCPATFATTDVGPTPISGRPAFLKIASCGSVADAGGKPGSIHSEAALIIAIQGDQDLYTIQLAERGTPSATPLPVDVPQWKAALHEILPIHICPIVPGERAPYPSCTAK